MDFVERLTLIAKTYNITQERLGKIFGVGQTGYSKIKRKKTDTVKIRDVAALTKFLHEYNINPSFLFGFTDSIAEIRIEKSSIAEERDEKNELLMRIENRPTLQSLLIKLFDLLDNEIVIVQAAVDAILAAHSAQQKDKAIGE